MNSQQQDQLHRDLLGDLLAAPVDLRRVARRRDLALDDFSHLASSPGIQECLRQFAQIHDACARIAIGRQRMRAIQRLSDNKDELTETQRKACVDLIKSAPASLAPDTTTETGDPAAPLIDHETQTMIRQALDAIATQPPDDDA